MRSAPSPPSATTRRGSAGLENGCTFMRFANVTLGRIASSTASGEVGRVSCVGGASHGGGKPARTISGCRSRFGREGFFPLDCAEIDIDADHFVSAGAEKSKGTEPFVSDDEFQERGWLQVVESAGLILGLEFPDQFEAGLAHAADIDFAVVPLPVGTLRVVAHSHPVGTTLGESLGLDQDAAEDRGCGSCESTHDEVVDLREKLNVHHI